ncbi:MAG TPA: hypothetical protein VGH85_21600 [Mycobacteriales bacterium]
MPVVTVTENLVWSKGRGLVRHGGKSDAALRVIPLPTFAVELIRLRLDVPGEPWWPLFPTTSRKGQITYRWPANVRRTLRKVREQVGLEWMTPHTWRRTYATILDDELTLTDRIKADLMGHAKFLKNEYVSRGELHPSAAVVVDSALNGGTRRQTPSEASPAPQRSLAYLRKGILSHARALRVGAIGFEPTTVSL